MIREIHFGSSKKRIFTNGRSTGYQQSYAHGQPGLPFPSTGDTAGQNGAHIPTSTALPERPLIATAPLQAPASPPHLFNRSWQYSPLANNGFDFPYVYPGVIASELHDFLEFYDLDTLEPRWWEVERRLQAAAESNQPAVEGNQPAVESNEGIQANGELTANREDHDAVNEDEDGDEYDDEYEDDDEDEDRDPEYAEYRGRQYVHPGEEAGGEGDGEEMEEEEEEESGRSDGRGRRQGELAEEAVDEDGDLMMWEMEEV